MFVMLFLYIYNKQDTASDGFKIKFDYYLDMAYTQKNTKIMTLRRA